MTDTPPSPPRILLTSWKAIARYLQVDVRTVQRWQKKTDIPIYQQTVAARSHPTAYTDELDRWRTRRAERDAPAAPDQRPRSRTRRLPIGVVVLTVACLAIALGGFFWFRPGEPFRAAADRDTLIVFDASDRVCWRTVLPGLGRATDWEPVQGGNLLVYDVNRDGRHEVLANVAPSRQGDDTGYLACFGREGRELWRFRYGRPRSWGERTFNGKYVAQVIRVARGADRDYLLVAASHGRWFPSQVALLDPATGSLVEEYWHPGALRLSALVDVDGDGVGEVLLAGINNPGPGLGHPAVVALKVPFSRQPRRAGEGLADFTGGREAGYALFPRPDTCWVTGQHPFVSDLSVEMRDRILVQVTCAGRVMVHTLDLRLQPIEMRVADGFAPRHQELRLQGLLDHEFSLAEQRCLARVAVLAVAPDGNSPDFARFWRGCE